MAVKPKATSNTGNALIQRAKVNLPANIQEAMSADVAAFQNRMSAPVGVRIAVTQDKKFKNAAGDKFDSIRGVVVDFIARKGWYENDYDKEDVVPPNCFAMGFVTHDALEASENSPELQHDGGDCRTCPKNQFKSAKNGKGKACKDSYVLALLSPNPDESGNYAMTTLSISATGLKPFEKYVRDLARDYGKAPYCFVTEFVFDSTMDWPSVRCVNPELAEVKLIEAAWMQREEAAKLLSVEPNVAEFDEKVVAKRVGSKGAATKKPALKAGKR